MVGIGSRVGRRGRRGSVSASPDAVRVSTARLTDLRLWAGALLLAASALAGWLLLGAGPDVVTVWRASADLAVGSAPRSLEAVEVPRAVAGESYARPGDRLDRVLRWPLAAGELLPRAALTDPTGVPTRRVTVPIDPMHAPTAITAGDLVDVWSVARPEAGVSEPPALVLPGARVAVVSSDASGFGGEVAIALDVPLEAVPALVAAGRTGLLDLVAVPGGSQQVDL